jgi:hypothetical protein
MHAIPIQKRSGGHLFLFPLHVPKNPRFSRLAGGVIIVSAVVVVVVTVMIVVMVGVSLGGGWRALAEMMVAVRRAMKGMRMVVGCIVRGFEDLDGIRAGRC